MNFIDKAISFVNPKAAVNRMRARLAISVLDRHVRKYEAAARGRRTNGFPLTDGSANTETWSDLGVLRARARHLVRNNSYAQKAVKAIANNVVGAGIIPQPTSAGGQKAKLKKIKFKWTQWANKKECDYMGQMNFYGLMYMAIKAVAESGEVLVLKRRTGKYKLQLQVIEADYLDSSRDTRSMKNGSYVTQGVEFDSNGKRKGYWIFDKHPLEHGAYESTFRPASDVIHLYEVLRPGQVRGVPFGVSSMLRLKDYDDYEDAEVVRQKIAACFAAFVQDSDPAATIGTGSSDDVEAIERIEPGQIEYLPPGKTITFANPPTTSNYDNFSRKILQGIAAGYGITYEALTGDLSNVNFSSGRMGWIEMSRQIAVWQYNMIIPMFCDEIWSWFMDNATIMDGIKTEDIDVLWTPPRREMIDPKKETEAQQLQVRNGFKSWSEAVRENGFEPEQVIEEIKKDNAMIDAAKLSLDSDGRKDITLKATAPPSDNPPNQ